MRYGYRKRVASFAVRSTQPSSMRVGENTGFPRTDSAGRSTARQVTAPPRPAVPTFDHAKIRAALSANSDRLAASHSAAASRSDLLHVTMRRRREQDARTDAADAETTDDIEHVAKPGQGPSRAASDMRDSEDASAAGHQAVRGTLERDRPAQFRDAGPSLGWRALALTADAVVLTIAAPFLAVWYVGRAVKRLVVKG